MTLAIAFLNMVNSERILIVAPPVEIIDLEFSVLKIILHMSSGCGILVMKRNMQKVSMVTV